MMGKLSLRIILMLLCFVLMSCHNSINTRKYGVEDNILSKAIQDLSFDREMAELYVAMSPEIHRDNSVLQAKYGRAAALANSFIDKLKFSFTIRNIDSNEMAKDVKKVADAVNELNDYVNSLHVKYGSNGTKTASSSSQLISPLSIDSIVNSALNVWKASREREDKLIEDIKKELDRQRWKTWKDLVKNIS